MRAYMCAGQHNAKKAYWHALLATQVSGRSRDAGRSGGGAGPARLRRRWAPRSYAGQLDEASGRQVQDAASGGQKKKKKKVGGMRAGRLVPGGVTLGEIRK